MTDSFAYAYGAAPTPVDVERPLTVEGYDGFNAPIVEERPEVRVIPDPADLDIAVGGDPATGPIHAEVDAARAEADVAHAEEAAREELHVSALDEPVVLDEPAVLEDPVALDQPAVPVGPTGRPIPEFPVPAALSTHGPAVVIALCNQKGGVGKTTTTINLGAALAEYGRRVLLVDFDPQGALCAGLGIRPHELERTIYNVLVNGTDVRDVILPTAVEGLHLLPSNIDLSAAEVQLVSEVGREQVLVRSLGPVMAEYDFILIDCQPSLGLLTVNALTAADSVIIPLECEYFALRGVALLRDTIHKVSSRINPRLTIEGVLPTMYDRTLHAREVLERVSEAFGDQMFHTVVSRTIKFAETSAAGRPITTYARTSPGAESYRMLARELVWRRGQQA